jgi:TetR/AcrR family fatty acid metabolism transcriptional regulator
MTKNGANEKEITKRLKTEIRRGQILKAAEQVFAEKGFQDATISDVAKKAKLSDGTIYDYFPSKEDLLFSIPAETVRKGSKEFESHLQYIRGAVNKIRAYVYHLLSVYQDNPSLTTVTMMLKPNRRFLETDAYQHVREGYRALRRIIDEGMASGELRSDINPYLIRSVIIGTIEQMAIRSVLLGSPKNLMEFVDPLTDLLLDGIRNEEKTRRWNISVILAPEKKRKETSSNKKKTRHTIG